MDHNEVEVTVYGAEKICASCVGAPGSKDTYEWLQAAIGRKYNTTGITFKYIDIYDTPSEERHEKFAEQIVAEDYLYPVVLVNDQLVAEGIPKLKEIYQALDQNEVPLYS